MASVLGICGSARKKGSTATLLKEVLTATGLASELVWLSDLQIRFCQGCHACMKQKGRCIIEDDMAPLLDKFLAASALVVASPNYYYTVSGLMKNMIDRSISLNYRGVGEDTGMAFHGFLRAIYAGEPLMIYGDGEQTRDFTYIADVVEANLLAMTRGETGAVYNIAGGARVTVNQCLEILQRVTGQELRVIHLEPQHGEMRHTYADIALAQRSLGYAPRVSLEEGLAAEDAWYRETFWASRESKNG